MNPYERIALFKKKVPSKNDVALDAAIADAFRDFAGYSPNQEGYPEAVDAIVKLKTLQDNNTSKREISYDAMLAVAGNLAGILLILNFERAGVVASKALSFVTKLK